MSSNRSRIPSARSALSLAICSLFSAPLFAADLDVSVQIPQLDTAEYHRPYVAVWLESADRTVPATLALWYQQKRGGAAPGAAPAAAPANGMAGPQAEGGTKWLPDLRQWWRRTGREMKLPADGVSGATRVVGDYRLSFKNGQAPLGDLPPGQYKLMVEAAREDGGRELVDIPFQWPATAAQELKAQGKSELGAVTLALKP